MLLHTISASRTYTFFWFLVLFLLSYVVHLGMALPNLMEARNFVTAREMLEFGNWLLPTMNGEPRFAKPPLPTWETALLMGFTGITDSLFILRLPAVAAGIILVLSLYFFIIYSNGTRLLALVCASVLATTVMMLQMARIGSWDIHCHAWIMAGLAAWMYMINKANTKWPIAVLTAVFFAMSFYAKGPISFYTVLLPFIIASLFFGSRKWKSVPVSIYVLSILVVMILSAAWPLYVYFHHAETGTAVMQAETTAWINRHVKPFYFYLNFPLLTGIWLPFAIAVFVWNYSKRHIGNYWFYFVWTIGTFILLSVIPEKKDRYLLPMMLPLSILIGSLICSLLVSDPSAQKRALLYYIHRWLLVIVCLASIVALIYFGVVLLQINLLLLLIALPIFILMLIILLSNKLKFSTLFLTAISLVLAVNVFLLPLSKQFLYPNRNYRSLSAINKNNLTGNLPVYCTHNLNMMYVYDVGKRVHRIDLSDPGTFPKEYPACVISLAPLSHMLNDELQTKFDITEIDVVDPSYKKSEWMYHISVVNRND